MKAKRAGICQARSRCARRKGVERQGMVIEDIPAADAGEFKGLQRIATRNGDWHGPVLFCPFCGRPASYAASWRAWQQGLVDLSAVAFPWREPMKSPPAVTPEPS